MNVANFIAQYLHAPGRSGRADTAQDGIVERLSLFESLVKRHFAQLAAHCRLRELGDGVNGVVDLVRGLDWVHHPEVEDAVDGDGNIVVGNGALLRNAVCFLFQAVNVGDLIDYRHEELQPWLQDAAEFSKALNHPRLLMRHHVDAKVRGQ